jgi:hypothetical protein
LYPFEVPFEQVEADPEPFISAVFSSLDSGFLDMPKGPGFIEYPVFENGYEALKMATSGFSRFEPSEVIRCVSQTPIVLVVVRSMLGFTPSEWAYVASQRSGEQVTQGAARTIDREVRLNPTSPLRTVGVTARRVSAMVETACKLLSEGAPSAGTDRLHRLDKIDTKESLGSLQTLANIGVPYAMLLYERFLGRPFAGHRDSVSELVGDSLESAIEDQLTQAGISFRKTKRAERILGFDQTPDFIIPSELNPQVIIEAKLTEDDGTARDKATRIQHLGELSTADQPKGQLKYEVVACIGGRGFGVRREDMKKMLLATRGKVFTQNTLQYLVPCSRLREFQTRR